MVAMKTVFFGAYFGFVLLYFLILQLHLNVVVILELEKSQNICI